ncbi:MAG: DEAD/DEAH box helicase [Deltaproteobacteria bacterium]|nr:DEAD/DEAH box helicase [Deltaproteobacteria bacterium]
MLLRDYQRECLKALGERYRAGVRRQLVCLPTGTGKTVIFAEFPRFFRMKKRMLVLAHREELLDQARDKILRANPELSVDVEQAGRHAGPESDVVVASVPTLGRAGSGRIGRLDPDQFYLIVVDEAHHATAETYRRTLEHFGVFEPDTKRLLVGFTATPKRGDGQGLDGVFEEISFSRALPEMVRAGYLAPLAAYRVETDVDLTGVKTRLGDFVTSHLSRAVNVQERNDLVVRVYRDRLDGRQTLCFCVDVAHAQHLAEAFGRAGIPSAAVTGETPRPDREATLAAFREGSLRVLTNCMVLTEGYDEPSVSGILLARPTKSTLLYTQMIGRGTRLHPGKDDVTVVDIVDASRSHRLVTLPTLFGLPAAFDLAGHTTDDAWEAFRWAEENRPWVRTDLATSLDDLRYRCTRVDLFDLATPAELVDCTRLAWASLGSGGYRLSLPGGDAVTVTLDILGSWEAVARRGGAEEEIGRASDPCAAVRAADAYVESRCAEAVPLLFRHGRWRREPASEKQLQLLRERKLQLPGGLTKGQASHLIGMLPRRG